MKLSSDSFFAILLMLILIIILHIGMFIKLNSIDSLVRTNSGAILNLGEHVLNQDSNELDNLKKQEIIGLVDMLDGNRYLNNELKKSVASLAYFWASHYNLSPKLVMSIILVESSGNPSAASNRDAKGLMQVTKLHYKLLDPYLIENNIMIGTTYLAYLVRRYGQDGGIKRYFCGETSKSCLGSIAVNNYLSKVTVVLNDL